MKTHVRFTPLLLTLVLVLPSLGRGAPNVAFILVDDFGYYDVGYNGDTFYETPRMDALAEEWMRFDNCYTPSQS